MRKSRVVPNSSSFSPFLWALSAVREHPFHSDSLLEYESAALTHFLIHDFINHFFSLITLSSFIREPAITKGFWTLPCPHHPLLGICPCTSVHIWNLNFLSKPNPSVWDFPQGCTGLSTRKHVLSFKGKWSWHAHLKSGQLLRCFNSSLGCRMRNNAELLSSQGDKSQAPIVFQESGIDARQVEGRPVS